ncbi:MAG: zinc-dependent alcohol dehydrogenase [Bryobacterales bacterium]|nr:zinc-dependent alcohol dehydrogenase [Bryobacterales bacterium]
MLTTQAALLRVPCGPVSVETITIPEPGAGEVLLRMEACGLCHADVLVAGMQNLPMAPLVLGHEGIGRIEALGPGVEGWRPGDRVGVTFLAATCGQCEYCRTGRERFCPWQSNMGFSRHGLMAQWAVAPVQYMASVPENLTAAEAAPLCCAGWSAWSAVCETGLEAGQHVALFGMGGLGHLAVQYARERGLRVVAVDVSENKLRLARRLGAELTLPAEDAGRTLLKQFGGVDAAVVMTSSTDAIREAFRALKRGGILVLVGLSNTRPELPLFETILKGITVRGHYLGNRQQLDEVFRLAARGVGRPQVEAFPLPEAPRMMERLKRGELVGRAVAVMQA